jgi:hypothetical protein
MPDGQRELGSDDRRSATVPLLELARLFERDDDPVEAGERQDQEDQRPDPPEAKGDASVGENETQIRRISRPCVRAANDNAL